MENNYEADYGPEFDRERLTLTEQFIAWVGAGIGVGIGVGAVLYLLHKIFS